MKKLTDTFFSDVPENEFILVKATFAKREAEDKSPGSPKAPIPLLYALKFSLSEKRFSGCFGKDLHNYLTGTFAVQMEDYL